MNINLDTRLKAIADMLTPCGAVADIGCDHGYLCAYLIEKQVCKTAIASDINKQPLESARNTAVRYGTYDNTQFVLSNGLDKIPENTDAIVIAGMGGELISKILENCPWIKDANKQIVLQPMTKVESVRRFCYENGFEIIDEACTSDSSHVYCIMKVAYTGKIKKLDDVSAILGTLKDKTDDMSRFYINHRIAEFEKLLQKLVKTQETQAVQSAKQKTQTLLNELNKFRR